MLSKDVSAAITKSKPGIEKYLALMELHGKVNVTTDPSFQRAYNGFYRMRQRTASYYQAYYALMEQLRGSKPTFDYVLDALHMATGRFEPSFASKMIATLNPDKPVWDKFVLQNLGMTPPASHRKTKIDDAKKCYSAIEGWYKAFLASAEGANWIMQFNQLVPSHAKLTNLKKVDLILWQTRT